MQGWCLLRESKKVCSKLIYSRDTELRLTKCKQKEQGHGAKWGWGVGRTDDQGLISVLALRCHSSGAPSQIMSFLYFSLSGNMGLMSASPWGYDELKLPVYFESSKCSRTIVILLESQCWILLANPYAGQHIT